MADKGLTPRQLRKKKRQEDKERRRLERAAPKMQSLLSPDMIKGDMKNIAESQSQLKEAVEKFFKENPEIDEPDRFGRRFSDISRIEKEKRKMRASSLTVAQQRAGDEVLAKLDKKFYNPAFSPVGLICDKIPRDMWQGCLHPKPTGFASNPFGRADSNPFGSAGNPFGQSTASPPPGGHLQHFAQHIEEQILANDMFIDVVSQRLTNSILSKYDTFIKGMETVAEIDSDLSATHIYAANARETLSSSRGHLVSSNLRMISKRRRRARLGELVHLTSVLGNSMGLESKVTEHLQLLQYPEAMTVITRARDELNTRVALKLNALNGIRHKLPGLMNGVLAAADEKLKGMTRHAFDSVVFGRALGCYLMLDAHSHAAFVASEQLVEIVPTPTPVTITITCSRDYRRGEKVAARLPSGKRHYVRMTEAMTKGQAVTVQVVDPPKGVRGIVLPSTTDRTLSLQLPGVGTRTLTLPPGAKGGDKIYVKIKQRTHMLHELGETIESQFRSAPGDACISVVVGQLRSEWMAARKVRDEALGSGLASRTVVRKMTRKRTRMKKVMRPVQDDTPAPADTHATPGVPDQDQNPFGGTPTKAANNPFGQTPATPANDNPFGQTPATPANDNPFGQTPATPANDNPFGNTKPSNPFGGGGGDSSGGSGGNPFGDGAGPTPPPRSNPFGSNTGGSGASSNPFGGDGGGGGGGGDPSPAPRRGKVRMEEVEVEEEYDEEYTERVVMTVDASVIAEEREMALAQHLQALGYNPDGDSDLNQLANALPEDKVVEVLVNVCEQMVKIMHVHYLQYQWLRAPMSPRNTDTDYLHRCGLYDETPPDVDVDDGGGDGDGGDGDGDGGENVTAEKNPEENSGGNPFEKTPAVPRRHVTAKEASAEDKLTPSDRDKLMDLQRAHRSSRSRVWEGIQHTVAAFLESVPTDSHKRGVLESLCNVNYICKVLIVLGNYFGKQGKQNMGSLQRIVLHRSTDYYANLHRRSFGMLKERLADEMWNDLRISLGSIGGMSAVVLGRIAIELKPILNSTWMRRSAYLGQPATTQQACPLRDIVRAGNPFCSDGEFSYTPNLEAEADALASMQEQLSGLGEQSVADDDGLEPAGEGEVMLQSQTMAITTIGLNAFAKFCGQYVKLMYLLPSVAKTALEGLIDMAEYYVYCVFVTFFPVEEQERVWSYDPHDKQQVDSANKTSLGPDCMLWGDMATKLQQLRHQLEDPANLRDASKAEPDLTSTPKAAAEPAKPVAKPKTLTLFAKLAKQEKPKTPKNKGIKLGFAEPKAPTLRPSSIRLTRVDDLQPQNDISSNLFGLAVRSVGVESLLFVGHVMRVVRRHAMTAFQQLDTPGGEAPDLAHTEKFFQDMPLLLHAMRKCLYQTMSPRVAELGDGTTIPQLILATNWHSVSPDQFCRHHDYVNRITAHMKSLWQKLERLKERFPPNVLDQVWASAVEHVMTLILEGFAAVKKCSAEGRGMMALDLTTLVGSLTTFHKIDPKLITRDKAYVDGYIKAYYFDKQEDLMSWVKSHVDDYSHDQIISLLRVGLGAKMKKNDRKALEDTIGTLYGEGEGAAALSRLFA